MQLNGQKFWQNFDISIQNLIDIIMEFQRKFAKISPTDLVCQRNHRLDGSAVADCHLC